MTLYEQLGGENFLALVVPDLYERVTSDPALADWFSGVDLDQLITHQQAYFAVILGGPELYAGRSMRSAHTGMGITGGAFDALVGHLVDACGSAGIDAPIVASLRMQVETLRAVIVEEIPSG